MGVGGPTNRQNNMNSHQKNILASETRKKAKIHFAYRPIVRDFDAGDDGRKLETRDNDAGRSTAGDAGGGDDVVVLQASEGDGRRQLRPRVEEATTTSAMLERTTSETMCWA